MDWTAIAAIGQIGAALGVIASLVYLGRQIRQSLEQSKLTSSQAVDSSNMHAFDPLYIPENSQIWTKGHVSPELLTEHERYMFGMFMARLIASFNTTAYQYSRGTCEGEVCRPLALYYGSLVKTCGGAQWYATNRHILHPVTQEMLDGKHALVREVERSEHIIG
jgi:hypothetical protein